MTIFKSWYSGTVRIKLSVIVWYKIAGVKTDCKEL